MFKSNRDRNRILDCSLYLSINIQNYQMCLRRIQFNAVIQKTAVLTEQIENSCRKIQINGIIIMVIFSIKNS